jgi:hypothetical protein
LDERGPDELAPPAVDEPEPELVANEGLAVVDGAWPLERAEEDCIGDPVDCVCEDPPLDELMPEITGREVELPLLEEDTPPVLLPAVPLEDCAGALVMLPPPLEELPP